MANLKNKKRIYPSIKKMIEKRKSTATDTFKKRKQFQNQIRDIIFSNGIVNNVEANIFKRIRELEDTNLIVLTDKKFCDSVNHVLINFFEEFLCGSVGEIDGWLDLVGKIRNVYGESKFEDGNNLLNCGSIIKDGVKKEVERNVHTNCSDYMKNVHTYNNFGKDVSTKYNDFNKNVQTNSTNIEKKESHEKTSEVICNVDSNCDDLIKKESKENVNEINSNVDSNRNDLVKKELGEKTNSDNSNNNVYTNSNNFTKNINQSNSTNFEKKESCESINSSNSETAINIEIVDTFKFDKNIYGSQLLEKSFSDKTPSSENENCSTFSDNNLKNYINSNSNNKSCDLSLSYDSNDISNKIEANKEKINIIDENKNFVNEYKSVVDNERVNDNSLNSEKSKYNVFECSDINNDLKIYHKDNSNSNLNAANNEDLKNKTYSDIYVVNNLNANDENIILRNDVCDTNISININSKNFTDTLYYNDSHSNNNVNYENVISKDNVNKRYADDINDIKNINNKNFSPNNILNDKNVVSNNNININYVEDINENKNFSQNNILNDRNIFVKNNINESFVEDINDNKNTNNSYVNKLINIKNKNMLLKEVLKENNMLNLLKESIIQEFKEVNKIKNLEIIKLKKLLYEYEQKGDTNKNDREKEPSYDIFNAKIKSLEEINKHLEEENVKLVSEKLSERNKFINQIEKEKNEFEKNLEIARNTKENEKNIRTILVENLKEMIGKIKDTRTNDIDLLLEKCKSLTMKLESYNLIKTNNGVTNSSNENLKSVESELINTIKSYQETLKTNNEILRNLQDKEIEIVHLKLNLEKSNLKDKNIDDKINEITEKKEKIAELKKELEKTKNNFMERSEAAKYHKRQAIKFKMEIDYLVSKLETYKKEFTEIKNEKNKNEDEVKLLEYDLELHRKLLRCTCCDSNYKDTVLMKCSHVFCKQCVDKLIEKRSRMCPTCTESFHTADIKKIYL